jgi:hypothetical protein
MIAKRIIFPHFVNSLLANAIEVHSETPTSSSYLEEL